MSAHLTPTAPIIPATVPKGARASETVVIHSPAPVGTGVFDDATIPFDQYCAPLPEVLKRPKEWIVRELLPR